jgi:hypothetical protein
MKRPMRMPCARRTTPTPLRACWRRASAAGTPRRSGRRRKRPTRRTCASPRRTYGCSHWLQRQVGSATVPPPCRASFSNTHSIGLPCTGPAARMKAPCHAVRTLVEVVLRTSCAAGTQHAELEATTAAVAAAADAVPVDAVTRPGPGNGIFSAEHHTTARVQAHMAFAAAAAVAGRGGWKV